MSLPWEFSQPSTLSSTSPSCSWRAAPAAVDFDARFHRPVHRHPVSHDVRQGAEGGLCPPDGPHHRPYLLCHRAIHRGDPCLLRPGLRPGELTRGLTHYRSIAGNMASFVLFSVACGISAAHLAHAGGLPEADYGAGDAGGLCEHPGSPLLHWNAGGAVSGAHRGRDHRGFIARAMFRKHFEKAGLV